MRPKPSDRRSTVARVAGALLPPVVVVAVAAAAACLAGPTTDRAGPGARDGPATVPSAVPVVCPAIEQDGRRRTNHPGETSLPIELVVVGTARMIVEANAGDGVYEAAVDRVLYGGLKEKAVRFTHPWRVDDKPHVFALVPAVYADEAPFELKYELDADEAASQAALSAARLDYHALSAACVFVGKELSADDRYLLSVEAVRTLAGPGPRAGERVVVRRGGYVRRADATPTVRGEPMVYFCGEVDTDDGPDHPIYVLTTRLPADQEAAVREALGRADQYPVIERKGRDGKNGRAERFREVLFRGATAEAIESMGSASEAAVALAARTLTHRRPAAEADVAAAVDRDLLRQDPPAGPAAGFRRLHHLIQLVGRFEQGADEGGAGPGGKATAAGGRLGGLVDRYIAHVASNPPEPPAASREARDGYWRTEDQRDDVNHALAWLLRAMDERAVAREYGGRLVRLRDAAKGRWRDEVQVALDAARVEDNLELDVALARMKDVKPPRAGPAFAAVGGPVAWSPDGRFLAAGTTVWDTAGWSRAGGFDLEGSSVEWVAFSPDGSSLYVFGGGPGRQVHARYDWRAGTAARAFDGHKKGLFWGWLSADGRTMASASYYRGEEVIRVWDAAAGKVVRNFDLPGGCYHVAVSPDGRTIARQSAKHVLTVEPLAAPAAGGAAPIEIRLPEHEANEIAFSPDGRSLVCTTFDFWDLDHGHNAVEVRLYDAADGYRLKTDAFYNAFRCTGLAFAPDGRHLVAGDQDGRAWVLSVPDLKVVRPLLSQKTSEIDRGSMAFSPDGRRLAIGTRGQPVRLFDTGTWDPVRPAPGHQGEVAGVYFTPDGKAVRTVGRDNAVCLWDAATMQLLSQTPLPAGTCVGAVRPPDGRIILCPDAVGHDRSVVDEKSGSPVVQVFDAAAGKVVAQVDLPVHWTYAANNVLWLNDAEALSLDSGRWRRFDYRAGKVLDDRPVDISGQNELYNGLAEATEDGKTLLSIDGGGKINTLKVLATDVATGRATVVGESTLPRFTGNRHGLVPGGKYFYVGDPGLYVFDRRTLKPVLQKEFRGSDLLGLAFSPDGSRFAVVTGGRIFIDDDLRQWDSHPPSVGRVHDAATGRTLYAFPASARWVRGLTFSPDGGRLAVALEGGAIEVWDLPAGGGAGK